MTCSLISEKALPQACLSYEYCLKGRLCHGSDRGRQRVLIGQEHQAPVYSNPSNLYSNGVKGLSGYRIVQLRASGPLDAWLGPFVTGHTCIGSEHLDVIVALYAKWDMYGAILTPFFTEGCPVHEYYMFS